MFKQYKWRHQCIDHCILEWSTLRVYPDLLTRQTCIDLDIMRVKLNEKTVDILKILSCYSVQIENSSRTFLVKQSKYCDIKYCSSFFWKSSKANLQPIMNPVLNIYNHKKKTRYKNIHCIIDLIGLKKYHSS